MWTRGAPARTVLALGMAAGVVAASAQVTQADDSVSRAPTAVLEGSPIPLGAVTQYHCHDLTWPVFRCFRTMAERDLDARTVTGERTLGSTPYVTVFEDEDYDGGSATFASSQTNLASIGWNDAITSFRSLNGGHPKFWDNANFSGSPYWQWAPGAWVSNVGSGANDKISSLKNVP